MKNKILVLLDYRGAFYSSVSNYKTICSYDIERVKYGLLELGYEVECKPISLIDLFHDYSEYYILYQSSEDFTQEYKSYIEDVLLFLEKMGGTLVPSFEYMRSHHNKNMMELLRKYYFKNTKLSKGSYHFGTFEELKAISHQLTNYPYIIKQSSGSGSKEVYMAKNEKELLRISKKISKCYEPFKYRIKEIIKRKVRKGHVNYTFNRRKFIIQEYIKKLDGDFKILHFGGKYFVLYRCNRRNDFRASGSGNFSYNIPSGVCKDSLLDFAEGVTKVINSPIHSLDIGYSENKFHLIEFQTIMFGTYTIENSSLYYYKNNNKWNIAYKKVKLEDEFVNSVNLFITKLRSK